jgi:hypothetical protein
MGFGLHIMTRYTLFREAFLYKTEFKWSSFAEKWSNFIRFSK